MLWAGTEEDGGTDGKCEMSNSINVVCLIKSMQLLMHGVKELGLAVNDLREANKEIRMLENCQGQKVEVDYVIKNEVGDKIGVRTNQEGNVEFVVQNDKSPTVKATVDKVTQAYARLKMLDEVKRKGYKSVKEEKLANGAIRLVVEKWR